MKSAAGATGDGDEQERDHRRRAGRIGTDHRGRQFPRAHAPLVPSASGAPPISPAVIKSDHDQTQRRDQLQGN